MINKGSSAFILHFVRAYPGRTAAMVALLVSSGLAEGVGVAALVPLLELGAGASGAELSYFAQIAAEAMTAVGIPVTLGPLILIIVAAMSAKGVTRWLAMRQVGFVVARVGLDLRLRLIRALMRAQWRYFSGSRTGHFSNAISREAHAAAGAYRAACQVFALSFTALMYAVIAALASWVVALGGLIAGLLVAFILRRLVNANRLAGLEQVQVLKALVARLTEALPNLKPLKAMSREEYVTPLLEAEAAGFLEAQKKQVVAAETLRSFQEPLLTLFLGGGLYAVLTYTTTPFATVLALAFIFHRLVGTVNKVQQSYADMAAGEAAFWSITELTEHAEQSADTRIGGTERPPEDWSRIRFEDVRFSYDHEPVIRGVDLEIGAGEFVALIGPSGSGKTTLVDLLVGLLAPDKGGIRIDHQDLRDMDLRAWRSQIGYVPQEPLLFHDSILKNVTLGDEDIPRDEVVHTLKLAGAWDFVRVLPDGLDTTVGERGATLSGGQRQRIAIARALIGERKLLILDEATTALDPVTEQAICDTLADLRGSVTIFAISHQPALRRVADRTVEIGAGTILSHERLTG